MECCQNNLDFVLKNGFVEITSSISPHHTLIHPYYKIVTPLNLTTIIQSIKIIVKHNTTIIFNTFCTKIPSFLYNLKHELFIFILFVSLFFIRLIRECNPKWSTYTFHFFIHSIYIYRGLSTSNSNHPSISLTFFLLTFLNVKNIQPNIYQNHITAN